MKRFFHAIFRLVSETLQATLVAGLLFAVIYVYVGQSSYVQGASMEPTFHTGDRIITSKITYKVRDIQRGDVVVITSPQNDNLHLIKRVVGLAGDTIRIQEGKVYLNDQLLEEDYISGETPLWESGYVVEGESYTVPEGFIFVLGDNRKQSSDSREFGYVPVENVIGQAVYRYYPLDQLGDVVNPFPEELRLK